MCFSAPSPSLTGLRCHPLSLWHFANTSSDALKCSLLRFINACSVNGRHWRRMLTDDTWQALNAFYRGSYSCLLPSGERGWMPKAEGETILSGSAGLAPCWEVWVGQSPRFGLCWLFLRNEYKWGSLRHPTCIQCDEFEREKSRFLLACFHVCR